MERERRKHRYHPGLQVGASSVAAIVLCFGVSWLKPGEPVITIQDTGDRAQITAAIWDGPAATRHVYPMSVVPGGVYSSAEAQRAADRDEVVARHYSGIHLARLQRTQLEAPVMRYVSFRRGNQVYWTRNAMPIPAGEAVLADGDSMVRSRCGNRLSETPKDPVLPASAHQPTVPDLEIPLPRESASRLLAADDAPLVDESGDLVEAAVRSAPSVQAAGNAPLAAADAGGNGRSVATTAPSARGFQGWNPLGVGRGGLGMAPPSQNPALSGPDAVGGPDPGSGTPIQVLPELPMLPSYGIGVSEQVLAVVGSPVGNGSTGGGGGISLNTVPEFTNSLISGGQTNTAATPGGSTPSGSIPGGSTPAQVPTLYDVFGEVSSVGLIPAVIPGLPQSSIVTSVPSNGNGTTPRPIFTGQTDLGTGPGGGTTFPDSAVPEPASMVLMLIGLAALAGRYLARFRSCWRTSRIQ